MMRHYSNRRRLVLAPERLRKDPGTRVIGQRDSQQSLVERAGNRQYAPGFQLAEGQGCQAGGELASSSAKRRSLTFFSTLPRVAKRNGIRLIDISLKASLRGHSRGH